MKQYLNSKKGRTTLLLLFIASCIFYLLYPHKITAFVHHPEQAMECCVVVNHSIHIDSMTISGEELIPFLKKFSEIRLQYRGKYR